MTATLYQGFDESQMEAFPLKLFLHSYGINLRYMGLFLHHLTRKLQRRAVLLGMV